MRQTLLVIPYKVKSMVQGWKGWRVHQFGIVIKEACECDTDNGCLLDVYEDEEPCKCSKRPPHTHTWAGYLGCKPIFYPRPTK